jgi:hypothetical protein
MSTTTMKRRISTRFITTLLGLGVFTIATAQLHAQEQPSQESFPLDVVKPLSTSLVKLNRIHCQHSPRHRFALPRRRERIT